MNTQMLEKEYFISLSKTQKVFNFPSPQYSALKSHSLCSRLLVTSHHGQTSPSPENKNVKMT